MLNFHALQTPGSFLNTWIYFQKQRPRNQPRSGQSTNPTSPASVKLVGKGGIVTLAERVMLIFWGLSWILTSCSQQRKLMGSSAQISSGVCRCRSQEQVPEEGSGRFWRVPVCAGVGSGSRFRRQVPEGSGVCWCRFRRQVPEGSGKSRCVVV